MLPPADVRQGLKTEAIEDAFHLIQSLASATRRDERPWSPPKAEDTPPVVKSIKLEAMIGTKAVGLHQGQRP